MIYLDTSAFLKLYFREAGSELVQQFVLSQDDPLPLWDLLQAEITNAFHLKVFWRDITRSQAAELLDRFDDRVRRGQYFVADIDRGELLRTFRKLSVQTAELGCRTMDILHVACAQQLAPKCFISFDDRQRTLAAAVGLNVLPQRG